MKKAFIATLTVFVFGLAGLGAVFADEVQVKAKFGANCEIKRRCADMLYVDCGAAVDGPAYYLDEALNVIGTSGGLCMGGQCSGPPEEWVECDGRQSDGPSLPQDE